MKPMLLNWTKYYKSYKQKSQIAKYILRKRCPRRLILHHRACVAFMYPLPASLPYLSKSGCRELLLVINACVSHPHVCAHNCFCGSGDVLTRIPFFCVFGREPCQHATRSVTLCGMTCIHASVSRSPRGHGSVAPDKRHCCQWMSKDGFISIVFDVSPVCCLFDQRAGR